MQKRCLRVTIQEGVSIFPEQVGGYVFHQTLHAERSTKLALRFNLGRCNVEQG